MQYALWLLNSHNGHVFHSLRSAVLKVIAPLASLVNLFNKSLTSANTPNEWTAAVVRLIYTNGDREDPGNYRPVSKASV